MTPKLFTGLGLAAAASILLAALVHASSDSWVSGAPTGAKLFPSLPRDAAQVATITLKQGSQSLTINRVGEGWTLKDRGGFAVNAERVRGLMVKLASAELVDRKTRSPERFALLELEDVTAKDAKSRLVSMLDDKGKVLAEVIVGKRSAEQLGTGKGGTYIRRPNEKETWLVNSEIDVNPAVNLWVDTTMFEAQIAKVKQVRIEVPGEPALVIDREAGKQANKDAYKLAGMPEGKKLKYEYAVEDMVNAFARVELEDVRGARAGHSATATWEAEDGLKIVLKVRTEGDERWAIVDASGTGDAKAEADKIDQRTHGWEYRLPSWKYDQIFKRMADLVEDAKKADEGSEPKK